MRASLFLALVCCAAASVAAQVSESAATIADRYRTLNFARELDRAGLLLAPQAMFIDPTTDVFQMPLAGGVQGRDTITALEKEWNLKSITWSPTFRFTSSGWDVAAGVMKIDDRPTFPLVNILRIEDGLVQERIDFGDYGGFTAAVDQGRAGAELQALAATAKRYLAAYCVDATAMGAELSDSAAFRDPTAHSYDPQATPAIVEGREAIARWFAQSSGSLVTVSLEVKQQFYSRHHAIAVTVASGTVRIGPENAERIVSFSVPLVIALEIRDGKITKHEDFWDVEQFWEQVRRRV